MAHAQKPSYLQCYYRKTRKWQQINLQYCTTSLHWWQNSQSWSWWMVGYPSKWFTSPQTESHNKNPRSNQFTVNQPAVECTTYWSRPLNPNHYANKPSNHKGGHMLSGWLQFGKKKIQGLFKDFSKTLNSLFQTYYVDVSAKLQRF